jgi:hypothetical protein
MEKMLQKTEKTLLNMKQIPFPRSSEKSNLGDLVRALVPWNYHVLGREPSKASPTGRKKVNRIVHCGISAIHAQYVCVVESTMHHRGGPCPDGLPFSASRDFFAR